MNNKDNSISVIRMAAMLMIILCHILQGLNNKWAFWFNVGVQIFFFISGYLYGKKKIDNVSLFYKKRIKKVLVPYMIVFTITLLLDNLINKNIYTFKTLFGCFFGLGFGNNIFLLSHTWFVSYILICYMLVPVLQFCFEHKSFKNSFLLFIFIMCLIQVFQIYGVISIEACWINNFIMGYYYGKCCIIEQNKKIYISIITVLFVIVMPFAIMYQENILLEKISFLNAYSNYFIKYGHVLLGTLLFLVLYNLLKKINISENKILNFCDKYSYYIYLVHQIFILYSFSVLFLTDYLIINIILILLLTCISAILVRKIEHIILKFIQNIIIFFKSRFFSELIK